jgi:hypothetical protein
MADRLTAETLCDRITRESLRHGINVRDGEAYCYCGIPAPESWDQHIAEATAAVFAPELTELATRAETAEAAIDRVRRMAQVWIDIRPTYPTATREGHGIAYAGQQIIAALDAPTGVHHERPQPAWCPAELPFGRYGENSHACLHERGHEGQHGCECGQSWGAETPGDADA